jgi:hypothetical protein
MCTQQQHNKKKAHPDSFLHFVFCLLDTYKKKNRDMHIVCEKSAYLLSFAAHVLVAAAADGSLRAKDHGTSGLRERKAGATFIILG